MTSQTPSSQFFEGISASVAVASPRASELSNVSLRRNRNNDLAYSETEKAQGSSGN